MTGLTTIGRGLVVATPDVVVVELGAEAVASGVQEALDTANAAVAAAQAALRAAGVATVDLQTARTSTWADTEQHRTTARLTLRATLRDVPGSGAAIRDALAAAGDVARLDSMEFAVADPGPLAVQAREAAFADARAKASEYAALAGRSLGQVVEISEEQGSATPMLRATMAKAQFDQLAIEPGTREIRAEVKVRWELAD